jgi:hypothetical protein
MLIEPTLHGLKKVFVLPSGDPPLFARGALSLYGATLTVVVHIMCRSANHRHGFASGS